MENNAIAVRILEGQALAVPVGIEGGNGLEACLAHSADGRLPLLGVRKIKDEQVVRGRRPPRDVAAGARELEMEGACSWPSMTPSKPS